MDGVEDLYENGEESTVGPDLPGAEARALARADRRKQRTQNGKRSGKVTYEETLSFRGKYHLYRIASAFPVPGSQLVLEARAARTKSDRKAAVAEAEAAEEARLATAKEHNDVAYANLRTIRLGGGPQLRLQAISDLFDGLRRGVAPLQITNPEELETFFMLVDTENVHKLNRMLAPGFPMINGCRGNAEATALHSSCAKGHLEVIQASQSAYSKSTRLVYLICWQTYSVECHQTLTRSFIPPMLLCPSHTALLYSSIKSR